MYKGNEIMAEKYLSEVNFKKAVRVMKTSFFMSITTALLGIVILFYFIVFSFL